MMSLPAEKLILSPEEYLALEARSSMQHEYVAGQIFAMVGGTLAHNTIIGNLRSALASKLEGGARSPLVKESIFTKGQ